MRSIFAVSCIFCAVASGGSLPFSRSGVMDTPDAYILAHTEVEAGVAGAAYSVEDATGSTDSEFKITGHIDVGLFRYGQAGVSWLADGGISGNVKVAILSEGIQVPAFAVGLENISGEEYVDCFEVDGEMYAYPHSQSFSAYGVLSKDMSTVVGLPATVSIGIGTGRFVGSIANGSLGIGSSWANGLFGSVSFRPSQNITLVLEEDGRDINIGMSYQLSRHFTVSMAWAEMEMSAFPPEDVSRIDVMQNSKFSLSVESRIGPLYGAGRLEMEREQMRIERARQRLQELEERRRAAEAELQRLRDLLEERD